MPNVALPPPPPGINSMVFRADNLEKKRSLLETPFLIGSTSAITEPANESATNIIAGSSVPLTHSNSSGSSSILRADSKLSSCLADLDSIMRPWGKLDHSDSRQNIDDVPTNHHSTPLVSNIYPSRPSNASRLSTPLRLTLDMQRDETGLQFIATTRPTESVTVPTSGSGVRGFTQSSSLLRPYEGSGLAGPSALPQIGSQVSVDNGMKKQTLNPLAGILASSTPTVEPKRILYTEHTQPLVQNTSTFSINQEKRNIDLSDPPERRLLISGVDPRLLALNASLSSSLDTVNTLIRMMLKGSLLAITWTAHTQSQVSSRPFSSRPPIVPSSGPNFRDRTINVSKVFIKVDETRSRLLWNIVSSDSSGFSSLPPPPHEGFLEIGDIKALRTRESKGFVLQVFTDPFRDNSIPMHDSSALEENLQDPSLELLFPDSQLLQDWIAGLSLLRNYVA